MVRRRLACARQGVERGGCSQELAALQQLLRQLINVLVDPVLLSHDPRSRHWAHYAVGRLCTLLGLPSTVFRVVGIRKGARVPLALLFPPTTCRRFVVRR